jgi:hypothetical protein
LRSAEPRLDSAKRLFEKLAQLRLRAMTEIELGNQKRYPSSKRTLYARLHIAQPPRQRAERLTEVVKTSLPFEQASQLFTNRGVQTH